MRKQSASGLIPVNIEMSARSRGGNRINLILPAMKEFCAWGGPASALRLFEQLAQGFDSMRIVDTVQTPQEFEPSSWSGWCLDDEGANSRSIAFPDPTGNPLVVHEKDFFLATAWPTAHYAGEIVRRQCESFGLSGRRFVYFIQDYEPGFYARSVLSVNARLTYENKRAAIALFNSKWLGDYFRKAGLGFETEFVFEPLLHPVLRKRRLELGERVKRKQILIYGRPEVPRNAFDLIVEGIELWAMRYKDANTWEVVSAGQRHDNISFENGMMVRSLGQLSMDQYAERLAESWIGIAFALLPHLGYPRFEMAEFGAWVITNKCEGRDLSDVSPAFCCVEELSADAIANRIAECCDRYVYGMTRAVEGAPSLFPHLEEFPHAAALLEDWIKK